MRHELKVGQEVYLGRRHGWTSRRYDKGVVAKLTPSGIADIKLEHCTIRLNPDGYERGNRYNGYSLDTKMSVAERIEWLRRDQLRASAVDKLNDIYNLGRIDSQSGAEYAKERIQKVQQLLDAAKEAICAT